MNENTCFTTINVLYLVSILPLIYYKSCLLMKMIISTLFSCAEYESPDITEFVGEVNNAPPKNSVAKLCVEDPVSVSRKYSLKFHAFFHQKARRF